MLAGIVWETRRAVSLVTLGADVSMYMYHPLAEITKKKPNALALLVKQRNQTKSTGETTTVRFSNVMVECGGHESS